MRSSNHVNQSHSWYLPNQVLCRGCALLVPGPQGQCPWCALPAKILQVARNGQAADHYRAPLFAIQEVPAKRGRVQAAKAKFKPPMVHAKDAAMVGRPAASTGKAPPPPKALSILAAAAGPPPPPQRGPPPATPAAKAGAPPPMASGKRGLAPS